jgi:hypothetical protein
MGMGSLWKWIYLIGLVVAGLVAAFNFTMADPYLGWLLLLAAILSGIFFLDSGDVVNFGIRVLLFFAVLKGFDAIPAPIGPYLTGFFTGVWGFLAPAGLTLLIVYFWKKYFGKMM